MVPHLLPFDIHYFIFSHFLLPITSLVLLFNEKDKKVRFMNLL